VIELLDEPSNYQPVSYGCNCGGNRFFEPLDEPGEDGKKWHVCPCCGTRKLLPLALQLKGPQ
jgi:hypothetical protein